MANLTGNMFDMGQNVTGAFLNAINLGNTIAGIHFKFNEHDNTTEVFYDVKCIVEAEVQFVIYDVPEYALVEA